MSRSIQTILSPSLFEQVKDIEHKIVVVIDVLRASSTLCTLLNNGAKNVRAVRTEEEARVFHKQGLLVGGERNGQTIEGFDLGNSPLDYTTELVRDREVVLTTTNGTKCLEMASKAKTLIVGSFLNLSAVCEFIDSNSADVVLFCAGWKDRVNLEDSLFAGAVCMGLSGDYHFDDASLLSQSAFHLVEGDLYRHLQLSSHFERLSDFGVERDIQYCCEIDRMDVVPVMQAGVMVLADS